LENEQPEENVPQEQPKEEEKPIVEVKPPIEEEAFEPIIRRFAERRGLTEDQTEAALRLAKLLKNAGVDPYESLKTISNYVDNIMNTLSKIPDTEVTKPMKDAIMARTIGQAAQELQDAMMKGGVQKGTMDAKINAILENILPYIVAMKTIKEAMSILEEKPKEQPQQVAAFTPKPEEGEAKLLREMLMNTYNKLLERAFESKTPEEQSELKEALKELGEKIEKISSEKKSFKDAIAEINETCETFGIPKPWEAKKEPPGLGPEHYIELQKLNLEKHKLELEDKREREKWKREEEAEKKKLDYVFKMFKPFADRLGERAGDVIEAGIKKIKETPSKAGEAYTDFGVLCPNCGQYFTVATLPKGKKLAPSTLPDKIKCPHCGTVLEKQEAPKAKKEAKEKKTEAE
jgi:hypothetical protein